MAPIVTPATKETLANIEPVGSPRRKCIDAGGRWDAATKTCIMPESKQPKPENTRTRIQRDEAGNIISTTTEPLRPITKQERLEVGLAGLGGQLGAREALEQKQVTGAEEAAIEAEKQRISDEERPIRQELDPKTSALERFPVLGGTFGAIKDALQNIVLKTVPEGEFKEAFKENLGVAQPNELRNLALREIQRKEIEKGLTASEQFGALLEGTGLSKLSIFGFSPADLVETPSENVDEVVANIRKEKRRISNIETNVKLDYLPIADAQAQLTDIENNVIKLEGRLILLINNAPELKFNSDKINTIETEVLLTKEKIFQGKQNILTGKTTDPDEILILQQLLLSGGPE